jgi:hypothetical protein
MKTLGSIFSFSLSSFFLFFFLSSSPHTASAADLANPGGFDKYADLLFIELLWILMALVVGLTISFGGGWVGGRVTLRNIYHQRIATLDQRMDTLTQDRQTRRIMVNLHDYLLNKAPDYMLCPLSKDLLVDPVVASDTCTYSRAEIMEWIDQSMTEGQPLMSPVFPKIEITRELVGNRQCKLWLADYTERKTREYERLRAFTLQNYKNNN